MGGVEVCFCVIDALTFARPGDDVLSFETNRNGGTSDESVNLAES